MPAIVAALLAGVIGACVGFWLGHRARARTSLARRARVQEIERIRATAELEALTLRRQAEVTAREGALLLRSEADKELRGRHVQLAEMETALAGRTVLVEEEVRAMDDLRRDLSEREAPLRELEGEKKRLDAELANLVKEQRRALERAAGTSTAQLVHGLVEAEIDEARALAAQIVRGEGESAIEVARAAKRLMGISGGRLSDRFYSERAQSVIPLPEDRSQRAAISA